MLVDLIKFQLKSFINAKKIFITIILVLIYVLSRNIFINDSNSLVLYFGGVPANNILLISSYLLFHVTIIVLANQFVLQQIDNYLLYVILKTKNLSSYILSITICILIYLFMYYILTLIIVILTNGLLINEQLLDIMLSKKFIMLFTLNILCSISLILVSNLFLMITLRNSTPIIIIITMLFLPVNIKANFIGYFPTYYIHILHIKYEFYPYFIMSIWILISFILLFIILRKNILDICLERGLDD